LSRDKLLHEAESLCKQAGAYAANGELEAACAHLQDALTLLRTRAPHPATIVVLINLGRALGDLGRWQQAMERFEQAVQLGGLLDVPGIRALAYSGLGMSLLHVGDTEKALRSFAEAEALYTSVGDVQFAASAKVKQGVCLLRLGRDGEAARRLEAAVEILRDLRDPRELGIALHNLANVRQVQGDDSAARELQRRAAELFRQSGDPVAMKLVSS
jgi:tetratricopeptide (TPR) repeat protein